VNQETERSFAEFAGQKLPARRNAYHKSDLGNAHRLVSLYRKDIRYVGPWGWLVWDKCRWARDQTSEISRCAQRTVVEIYKTALQTTEPERRAALVKHALKSESAGSISAMIKLAESQNEVIATVDEFDRDPWLFTVANYTIDLRTYDVREHRREDLITKMSHVRWDPAALCPQFMTFLNRIMNKNEDLIGFLQRAFGYALTGRDDEQCLFVFWGGGINGKSTLLNAVRSVFGEYATVAQSDSFLERRDPNVIRNDLADLAGTRLVTSVEIKDGKYLAEGLVKQLTGSDPMKARFLFREHFVFEPKFKLFLAVNHRPTIRGSDLAIWRRIRIVPFTVTIPEDEIDRELSEKLAQEQSGILNWLLEGCALWRRDGLGMPPEIKTATDDYRRDMDVLADWIEDCCVEDPNLMATPADMFGTYLTHCEKTKTKPISQTKFGTILTEKGFKSDKCGGVRVRRGIGLRTG
jgi:putative DNA primase/helicase